MNQDDCEGFSLKLFFSKILSLGGACKKQSVSLFVLNMVGHDGYWTQLENFMKPLGASKNYIDHFSGFSTFQFYGCPLSTIFAKTVS